MPGRCLRRKQAPILVYFFLGTSKQLSIGPDALGSLLVRGGKPLSLESRF